MIDRHHATLTRTPLAVRLLNSNIGLSRPAPPHHIQKLDFPGSCALDDETRWACFFDTRAILTESVPIMLCLRSSVLRVSSTTLSPYCFQILADRLFRDRIPLQFLPLNTTIVSSSGSSARKPRFDIQKPNGMAICAPGPNDQYFLLYLMLTKNSHNRLRLDLVDRSRASLYGPALPNRLPSHCCLTDRLSTSRLDFDMSYLETLHRLVTSATSTWARANVRF